MKCPTIGKSRRRLLFKFSDMHIRTKLLAIMALIVTVFLMIVLTVVISFHRIENVLSGVINADINNVMTNALTERELSSITADLNLLLGTFFEDQTHLQREGERLIESAGVLGRRVQGSALEAPILLFGRRMEFLLQQCRAVNTSLQHVSDADQNMVSGLDRLDEIIADKLINMTHNGNDTSILQQLSVLIVGYRQSLLEIGKRHAQRWPETYYMFLDLDADPLLIAIEELNFRMRTLMASDPQIADIGQTVIDDLQLYKSELLTLNVLMVELKTRMLNVENARRKATEILKKFDLNVVNAVNAANTKVLGTLQVTELSLVTISLALIVFLILLTSLFFKNIIKRPMDDICAGIKAFRQSNLDTRINLNRNDEWHLIEEALNAMAADLSNSYADLKTAQDLVSNIIDSMPSVLVGVNNKGMVTQWNLKAEQVTGICAQEARSQPLDKVFPNLAHEMDRILASIQDRRVLRNSKVRREDREDTRYEDVTIYPLVANGVEGAVIRVDDTTDQVQMEEMMIQSEKMLSVGGLAAGMAHEINNPLAGMMQTAQVMAQRLTADLDIPASRKAAKEAGTTIEAISRFMETRGIQRMSHTIIDSGQRVSKIVNNMLSFARKDSSTISPHDLNDILDKTIELAATDYDLKKTYDFKQIKIIKEYNDNLYAVPCQASKIQQVVLNVLTNGAQAMQGAKTQNPQFTIRTYVDLTRNMACMEIEDNGPGINEKTCKHIFNPFFTTKPVGLGTGLGLSVSYFIITEHHKGEMTVESSPGAGAKFVIRIPLTEFKLSSM
nr:ATP-binding protein [uncultured Desulfobacter sp.]